MLRHAVTLDASEHTDNTSPTSQAGYEEKMEINMMTLVFMSGPVTFEEVHQDTEKVKLH